MVVMGRTPRVLGLAPISGQHTVRKSCREAERSERSLACIRFFVLCRDLFLDSVLVLSLRVSLTSSVTLSFLFYFDFDFDF